VLPLSSHARVGGVHLLGQVVESWASDRADQESCWLSWPAAYSLQRREHLERAGLDGGHRSARGDPFGAGGVGATCYRGEVDWQDVAIRNVRYSLRTNRFDLPQARNRGQFEVAGISVWRALDRTMAGGRLEPVLRRPRPTVLLVGGWRGRRSSLVSRDRST